MESESKKTTNSNVIGIKQLKMMIKTGIPGKPEYTLFNSKLLSIKSKGKPFAEFPFYSDTHLYPSIKLQNATYERIVEFFFNKEDFLKTIRNKSQAELNVKELTPEQIKIENFELTLRLLFPTTFPLVNNIDNSVEYIIPSKKIFTLKGSNILYILPKRFDRKYSYLNIDSEIYTITKTVWNNDVMNHPVYSQFIQSYKEFDIWKSDPSLNIFKQDATNDNMNIILSYVFEAVQKSDEDQLFKKMYDDSDPTKAPYYNNNGNKRLDENTLAIQDFDNAIDELMRKDEKSLKTEIDAYDNDYKKLYIDLSGSLSSSFNTELTQIQKEHDSVLFSGVFTDKKKENIRKFKTKITDDITDIQKKTEYIDKLNEIITILELIQKKKEYINNLKTKKKKSSESSDYYVYLQKYDKDTKEEIKKKFLKNEPKYKLNLINLLGKLTSVKRDNYHNVSPDFSNLIDYLKTNITDFNNKRRINTFIKDLNIKFLSDPNYKKELEKIKSLYVEFYNLALVINGLKGRKIDNPIWRDAIFKMMNGTLEENYFNNKIWEPLQDCYHLENQNPDDKNKKSKKKCDPDVITVGLDIIPIESSSSSNNTTTTNTNTRKSNIQTIEIYLQMDMIEGKVDDSNVSKIKCAYDDEFLGSMFRDLINTGKQINNFPTEQVFFSAKKMLSEINEKKGGKTKKKKYKKSKSRKTKKYFR